jgi:hypothetical protein
LTPSAPRFSLTPRIIGKIAQLVEQRTENPCVPGSIPGLATIFSRCEKMSRRSFSEGGQDRFYQAKSKVSFVALAKKDIHPTQKSFSEGG